MVAGLGAVVFRGLIAVIHNLMFLGKLSVFYDANAQTPPSPWGIFVILVPVVGAVGVVFLVKNFAPEAKGHGVPEVMDAIYYNRGKIRPVVAAIKSLASALSIGSGGSVGREGPIIQIGSSFGSAVGQLLRVPAWQRIALIAGGAGGGIAATFNTPVGGVLFALEILMHEVSARTLVPVVIATVMATYIGQVCFGTYPSFVIPALETPYFHVMRPLVLLSYLGLGILMGVVAAVFIKSIYGFEDFFERRFWGNYYFQHTIGMFLVGVIMYALMAVYGHYYIAGVGYFTVQEILSGMRIPLYLLLLLFLLKLLATSLTLGSGASGGIFSPSLYLGATLGGAYGLTLVHLFPSLGISPPAFAVAGMAAVVGGATGAAMAAIVMIFEMTLDYNVIVPMTITVAVSYGVRRMLSRESIYTMKLVRRGHYIPDALYAPDHFVKQAKDMMVQEVKCVSAACTLNQFAEMIANRPSIIWYLVEEGNRVIGLVSKHTALNALNNHENQVKLRDIANADYITVAENETLFEIINRMHLSKGSLVLVTNDVGPASATSVKGLITRQQVADVVVESAGLFLDVP